METRNTLENTQLVHGGVAVMVRYYGPTNSKGSRLKVWANDRPARWFSRTYEANEDFRAVLDYIDSTFPHAKPTKLVKIGVDNDTDAFAML